MFLEHGCVQAAGSRGRPAILVDETLLGRIHQHGYADKIRYTADVVPVPMRQQDVTQPRSIVPRGFELIGGWLRLNEIRAQSKEEGRVLELRLDRPARTRVDQHVTLRMPDEHGGHDESRLSQGEPPR